jgi:hypothetical protein
VYSKSFSITWQAGRKPGVVLHCNNAAPRGQTFESASRDEKKDEAYFTRFIFADYQKGHYATLRDARSKIDLNCKFPLCLRLYRKVYSSK